MKPSDRIRNIAVKTTVAKHENPNLEDYVFAILEYLDEQADLKERVKEEG